MNSMLSIVGQLSFKGEPEKVPDPFSIYNQLTLKNHVLIAELKKRKATPKISYRMEKALQALDDGKIKNTNEIAQLIEAIPNTAYKLLVRLEDLKLVERCEDERIKLESGGCILKTWKKVQYDM